MPEQPPQNLQNYARYDPLFHFVAIPILAGNVLIRIYELLNYMTKSQDLGNLFRFGWALLASIALLIVAFKARTYALKVQDRVIRLEERLRLGAILPEPLRARIYELSESQLVALRFASDGEVTELVRTALDRQLPAQDIKKAIRTWRPDYWRV